MRISSAEATLTENGRGSAGDGRYIATCEEVSLCEGNASQTEITSMMMANLEDAKNAGGDQGQAVSGAKCVRVATSVLMRDYSPGLAFESAEGDLDCKGTKSSSAASRSLMQARQPLVQVCPLSSSSVRLVLFKVSEAMISSTARAE
jgi:hypothetical protein